MNIILKRRTTRKQPDSRRNSDRKSQRKSEHLGAESACNRRYLKGMYDNLIEDFHAE